MRVLMISRDPNTVKEGTAAFARMESYRTLVNELVVVPIRSFSDIHAVLQYGRSSFDLVTAQDPFETGLLALWCAHRIGARLEIQIHTDFLSPEFRRFSLKNSVRVLIARFVIKQATHLRVVSERIARSLRKEQLLPKKAIYVVPIVSGDAFPRGGDSDTTIRKMFPESTCIALMASRLTKEKNIDLAIRALAQIKNEVPQLRLVIVGDGPMKSELMSVAESLSVASRVVFLPWNYNVSSLMKASDFFVLTSRYEGYGLTLIEAAIAGCPIVATDVGLVGDILKDDSLFRIPVGDVGACARAFQKMVTDENVRVYLSRNARESVREISSYEAYLETLKTIWNSA